MNEIQQHKKRIINDYISSINLDDIDPVKIQNDLAVYLQEKPSVQLEYESYSVLLENGKAPQKKEKLKAISIYYTVEDMNDIPIPFNEKYILY